MKYCLKNNYLITLLVLLASGSCKANDLPDSPAETATVNYSESNAVIANPERGLQKYSITNNNYNTQSGYSNLSQSTLAGWRSGEDKVTALFRYFLLDAFLNTDISQTYLNNIQKDFDMIRNSGLKCLVRFSYSNGQGSSPQQPSKAQILSHLSQLKPLLTANRDVILTHQAGFIGTWGEWYYTNSSEFGNEGSINSAQWNNRKDIINAMLEATPEEIPLQVRYPNVKKTMYGNGQLNENTAYQNTPNARIGFFNDAFLNNWGDMGTFSVNSESQNPVGTADYNYLANETKYTPMSGETNGLNPPRTDAANALNEMELANWTCVNRDYHTAVWTNWINANRYDDILKKTGYRFVLRNSAFRVENNQLSVKINLENVGFARLFKQRNAYLVLQRADNGGQTHSFLLNTDPRTWEKSASIEQTIDISSLPQGVYDCYLHLPDANASLAARPEYAIQLANEGLWNADNGYNSLLQQVTKDAPGNSSTENAGAKISLNISPNPFSSQTWVSTGKILKNAKLTVLNTGGQVVAEKENISGKSFPIQRNGLSAGMYLMLLAENGNISFTKILIL
ncbi:MAG: DUF4832 domain-containing protein [Prevotellaceae bacterium]|jgi:hypothetical protein|nr:DUF4832 domain-containing protein [Prevotellaceae bacterium]